MTILQTYVHMLEAIMLSPSIHTGTKECLPNCNSLYNATESSKVYCNCELEA